MTNDKYVAMDVHKASVVIGVRDGSGKMISRAVVETKAQTCGSSFDTVSEARCE